MHLDCPAHRFALLALLIGVSAPVIAARPGGPTISPEMLYVRARAADAAGMTELAAAGYAQVLAATPNDNALAERTYRQALAAGNQALALRTARTLDAAGALPPDGRLLLLAEAVERKDWRGASALIDRVQSDGVFAFAVPALRAWIAVGQRNPEAASFLSPMRASGSTGAAYAQEQLALIKLAQGQYDEATAAVRALLSDSADRPLRLRFAAAATLARAGKWDLALSLLTGDDPTIAAARDRIQRHRPIEGAIRTPADGIAELYARLAIDVNRDRVSPIGLALARMANFLAPRNSAASIITAEMLASDEQYDMAIATLDAIPADDHLASAAKTARIQVLVRKGDKEEALREATAIANRSDASAADWARVGELQADAKRYVAAGDAYKRALDISNRGADDGTRWTLLLLLGNAQHDAGDWTAANQTLRRALAIAPDQPALLNFLGYSQLERRENLDEAQRLIERASALRPDDAAITDSLGWTYFVRGDIPRAIQTLERAHIGDPGEPTIAEHLGDAYWTAGRRIDARYAWTAALVNAADESKARLRTKIGAGLTRETTAP